jgi:poly-gamma-glutamate capsule biosynthesis protein CapA/YwtB (metallophosphatase superfamily)
MHRVRAWIAVLMVCAAPVSADTEITLTFGGDCVLGTREEWVDTYGNFDTCVDENGLDWCFSGIRDVFINDDFTLANLECVLQDSNQGHNSKKQHTFRGKTAYVQMLTDAGIEAVNIANNHYIDYNQSGEESTKAALKAAGIEYCGYGNLFIWEHDGIKIGFGGCRETVFYEENKAYVYREIQELKEKGCDVIVYSCHWGAEYSPEHNQKQERMAQYAVNSGADIVVGTHPHVVQGVENRDGCAVLYSLGNLVFGGTHELETFDAMLAQAILCFDSDKNYLGVKIELIPVLTSGDIPANDFRPVLAKGRDAQRILALVQADSEMDVSEPLWIPVE